MAFVHSCFFKFDFIGFVLLIAGWVLLRGILLRWRRSAMERMRLSQSLPSSAAPPIQPRIACPRCSAAVPTAARFCPHCGLLLHMQRPIPLAYSPYPRRRGWPWFLICVLLGVIGLAAYAWWRSEENVNYQAPSPPPPPVQYHYYNHR